MSKHKGFFTSQRWNNVKKSWYHFTRNPLSIVGLCVVILIIFVAAFANLIAPFPEDAERYMYKYTETYLPPSWRHIFGTDELGRDVLSRVLYGFRYSLMMVAVILTIVTPPGVVLGLAAGYFKGTWLEIIIMRVTDVFVGVPGLILAMAICSLTTPNLINAMLALSLMWWPWYTRLVYSMATSLRNEAFVQAAEVTGASTFHILFREILPNCLGAILTKVTLDAGFVILLGASLSYLGLGAQPPTPDLGTMVANGARWLPNYWWISMFPALAISLTILGFNMLGDGVRDIFATEEL
jgi:peptide/nickel transport system permease protein